MKNVFSDIFTRLLANIFYPVGRGFIDFTDTDYSNYLGLKWERELVGMTAVGLDVSQTEFNTIGKTGGEKAHQLTINEIPSHNHYINRCINGNNGSYNKFKKIQASDDDGSWQEEAYTSNVGENYYHNNLQPYKVVAYWKRVA